MSKPPATTQAAHAIMFWVLAGMAFALFAPAVLLPLWEESQEIHAHEQKMAAAVAQLEAQRDRNATRIEALKDDPLVIERIARRELNYKPEGEQVARYSSRELAALQVREPPQVPAAEPTGPLPAAWVHRVQAWMPAWPYHKLFVEMPNRMLMLLMAGGLLVTAFVLYGPKSGKAARGAKT
jgi:cell division protein FtsB